MLQTLSKFHKMWNVKNYKITMIVLLGICIHVLLLITVFDTYFKSPLEHGMTPVKSTNTPVSKRVVLFVADGLRAQAILDENEGRTPFLTSVRRKRGSWGISHTRVPTESRPGHVAMLAGIFEDPSAIFKGWKHNPVDFDSVINQSTNAWCIGSPDIVPIFNKDKRNHIHIYSYDDWMQDFGNKETTNLDDWVFQKTRNILRTSKDSEPFKQSGNVFFLHLLGLDTAGHAFKPHSNEYIRNIKFVDENIEGIEKLFNEIFPDNLTSFIFTSDHGMTDWGSHGSGLDHETYTPIIAWGAGMRIDNNRKDIQQIDVAPFISSLVGINYPTNNLGKVPIGYINIPDKNKLNNLLTNVQQTFKIFNQKQQRIEKTSFYYKPYKYLSTENFDKDFAELWQTNVSFHLALTKCDTLFDNILRAIDYCHNYFMYYILFSVSLGLVFWILYLATFLFINEQKLESHENNSNILKFFLILYNTLVIFMCYFQSFPFLYYIYFLFPGAMFFFLFDKCEKLTHILFEFNYSQFVYIIWFSSCITLFVYGFQYRFCFSLMMILISFSFFFNPNNSIKIEKSLKLFWVSVCSILSIFPLLPLMFTKFQIVYFILGYISWQFFIYFATNREMHKFYFNVSLSSGQKMIFSIQKIFCNFSFLNSLIISSEIIEHTSLLKYISWFLFLLPLFTILFSMKSLEVRIFTIILSFGPFYIMTTMSYELIFLTFYCALLTLWMLIEQNLKSKSNDALENFRRCLIFVALILIGFFGTGNIASLNSFDPMWVRCFLTVFSPFKMTILIFLKIILPFLYTTCVFRNIVLKTGMNLTNSFCVILLISDVMVFYFMYHIKNVGSWLEIGMSLSHFVVVECLTIGILVLYTVAYVFTNVEVGETLFKKFGWMKHI